MVQKKAKKLVVGKEKESKTVKEEEHEGNKITRA